MQRLYNLDFIIPSQNTIPSSSKLYVTVPFWQDGQEVQVLN
ncbi:MAG: hypothetical protein RIG63_29390 [Coleofasciculus chthonoplastes F3-SA18-01]